LVTQLSGISSFIVTRNERILAGSLNGILWLRIDGKGSYDISPPLHRFAAQQMAGGTRHMVVDLETCPTMDSTFMGTLTGIAIRLMEQPGGRLQVVNANARNRQLLENLGLDLIFEVDSDGSQWREERAMISAALGNRVCEEQPVADKRANCECMIQAHENLTRAGAMNAPKFRDVIECLKREMEALPV
jgi:anti-anti-sigma regulatory factor